MSVDSWYHTLNGKAVGPVSVEGMRGLVKEKKLTAQDLIWKSGMEKWQELGEVKSEWLKVEVEPVVEEVAVAKAQTAKVVLAAKGKPAGGALPPPAIVAQPAAKAGEVGKPVVAAKAKPVAKTVAKLEEEVGGEKKGLFKRWFKK